MTTKQTILVVTFLFVGSQALAFFPDKKLLTVNYSEKNNTFFIEKESYEPGFPNFLMPVFVGLENPKSVYCGEIITNEKTGEKSRVVINNTTNKNACSRFATYLEAANRISRK